MTENPVKGFSATYQNKDWTVETALDARSRLHEWLNKNCSKFIYQLERGEESGIYHYQICLHLNEKLRTKTLGKKLSDAGLGMWCAPISAEGQVAMESYCMKAETRVLGPWMDETGYHGEDLPTEAQLYDWQLDIRDYLLDESASREIVWMWDKTGNTGKSSFAKYMYYHHKILTLHWGNASDMANLICKLGPKRAYIFDLTRTKPATFAKGDIYATMEALKGGYLVNGKYEGGTMCWKPPQVVIFSNELPDVVSCSLDRWKITAMPAFERKEIAPKKTFAWKRIRECCFIDAKELAEQQKAKRQKKSEDKTDAEED